MLPLLTLPLSWSERGRSPHHSCRGRIVFIPALTVRATRLLLESSLPQPLAVKVLTMIPARLRYIRDAAWCSCETVLSYTTSPTSLMSNYEHNSSITHSNNGRCEGSILKSLMPKLPAHTHRKSQLQVAKMPIVRSKHPGGFREAAVPYCASFLHFVLTIIDPQFQRARLELLIGWLA